MLWLYQYKREAAGEYGSRPLYKMLGYFSIIGLLRVHCLLGDYTLALKMMDNIELNKKVKLLPSFQRYILICVYNIYKLHLRRPSSRA